MYHGQNNADVGYTPTSNGHSEKQIVNEPVHHILVLIAYAQNHSVYIYAQLYSETRGANSGLSFHLRLFFM